MSVCLAHGFSQDRTVTEVGLELILTGVCEALPVQHADCHRMGSVYLAQKIAPLFPVSAALLSRVTTHAAYGLSKVK